MTVAFVTLKLRPVASEMLVIGIQTPKTAAQNGLGGDREDPLVPVPGEQCVEFADGMVGDARKDIG